MILLLIKLRSALLTLSRVDLATVLGSSGTMTEELKIFPFGKDELLNIDKEDRKSYGSVLVQACKGSYGFEFYVRYLRLTAIAGIAIFFFFV